MFSIKVLFDNTVYNPVKLQSAKNDLMNGVRFEELEEMYDIRLVLAATIEGARELGWDMDEYIRENRIEENLYAYFAFGEIQPEVWYGHMMNAAMDYLQEKL